MWADAVLSPSQRVIVPDPRDSSPYPGLGLAASTVQAGIEQPLVVDCVFPRQGLPSLACGPSARMSLASAYPLTTSELRRQEPQRAYPRRRDDPHRRKIKERGRAILGDAPR